MQVLYGKPMLPMKCHEKRMPFDLFHYWNIPDQNENETFVDVKHSPAIA